jgi:hypothetical protein
MSSITGFATGLDHAGACAVGRDRRCDGGHLYPAGANAGLLHRRARLRCRRTSLVGYEVYPDAAWVSRLPAANIIK